MNILFVCTGNVSRSFLAERLLRKEIQVLGIEGVSVASAGLDTYPGIPADPVMVDYLLERSIQAGDHRARVISKEDVRWADLILAMERSHIAKILALWPWARGRTKLLLAYTSLAPKGEDIIDPFGKTTYHYRLVQVQIEKAVQTLAERLTSLRK